MTEVKQSANQRQAAKWPLSSPQGNIVFIFKVLFLSLVYALYFPVCVFPCLLKTNKSTHLPGSHECSAVLVSFVYDSMGARGGGRFGWQRERDPFWSLKTDRRESLTQWLTLHILSFGVGSGVWIHRGLERHRDHSERASKTSFLPCPNPPITDIL